MGAKSVHCFHKFYNFYAGCTEHKEGVATCYPVHEVVNSGEKELRVHNTPVNILSARVSPYKLQ